MNLAQKRKLSSLLQGQGSVPASAGAATCSSSIAENTTTILLKVKKTFLLLLISNKRQVFLKKSQNKRLTMSFLFYFGKEVMI